MVTNAYHRQQKNLGAFDRVRNDSQTYVVGTQKNCLNEMVLLSTQNILIKLSISFHTVLPAKSDSDVVFVYNF